MQITHYLSVSRRELHVFRLKLLGELNLSGPEGRQFDSVLAQPKRTALLAYLVLSKRFCRRDELLAVFWPNLDDEHARGALRVALHRLREELGEAIVTRGREEIGVEKAILSCDAVLIRDLLSRHRYSDALTQYSGELLPGFHIDDAPFFADWLDRQREALRQAVVAGAEMVIRDQLERQQFQKAISTCRSVLKLDATNEAALQSLLLACEQSGELRIAAREFREFEQVLARDFDLPVSDTLRERFDRMLSASRHSPRDLSSAARVLRTRPALFGLGAVAFAAAWLGSGTAHSRESTRWSAVAVAGPAPIARDHHVLVYDNRSSSLLLFGGRNAPTNFSDLWRIHLQGSNPRWEHVLTSTDGPAPRWMPVAVVAATSNRLIIHGGALGHTAPCSSDVWTLDHAFGRAGTAEWHRLAIRGERPPARADHRGDFDEANDRMIIYGGHDCLQSIFNDVWVLANAGRSPGAAHWARLAIDNEKDGPGPRRTHSAVYDPVSNRLIVFGGSNGFDKLFNDVWVLTNANGIAGPSHWIRLAARGAAPQPREGHGVAYDASTNRMFVFGGRAGPRKLTDTWVLLGANGNGEWAEWKHVVTKSAPPVDILPHPAAYEQRDAAMLIFGFNAHKQAALFRLSPLMPE